MREKVWKRSRSCGFFREEACRKLTTDEESRPPLNSRPMATQPALHSSAEELVKMLGIVIIIRIFNSAVRIDRPIAACLAPTSAHDETVSRFKPGDPLVEGLSIGDDGSAQEFGDHRFVGTARGRMVFEQWRKFGCPAKGCPMKTIIERFQAQNIACAEELLTSAVPDYQCKVAEKVFRTMLSPMLIGAEHQLCICIGAEVEACGIQREGEVFPIVDPPVIREAKSSCFVRPGLPFIERFRSRVEHDVADAYGSFNPVVRSVRSAMGKPMDHALKKGWVSWFSVEVIDPSQPTHADNRRKSA